MITARAPGQHGQIANRILRSLPKTEYEELLPRVGSCASPWAGSSMSRDRR